MNSNVVTFLVIPVVVFVTMFIVTYFRNKLSKPKVENNVQTPGKVQQFIANFILFLAIFSLIFAVFGILMSITEMSITFGVMALIFFVIGIFVKRVYNTSYQENDTYFTLKTGNKEYQVFYKNIIDWKPSFNEIAVLDESKPEEKYIRVNIVIFKPEILLRKIADMAFEGKFKYADKTNNKDPGKEIETVKYLVSYHYDYLVEDYIDKIRKKA